MKDLLTYLVENLTGNKDFEIEEEEDNGVFVLRIFANPKDLGLIIGKGGQTIKAIQTVVRVRGKLEGKNVNVFVQEKSENT